MKNYRIFVEGYYEFQAVNKEEAINIALTLSQNGGQKLQEANIPLMGIFAQDDDGKWVIQ